MPEYPITEDAVGVEPSFTDAPPESLSEGEPTEPALSGPEQPPQPSYPDPDPEDVVSVPETAPEPPPLQPGQVFDDGEFADPKLKLDAQDGHEVDEIILTFTGSVKLDRKNPDHVRIVRGCKLGKSAFDGNGITALDGTVLSKKPAVKLDEDGFVKTTSLTVGVQITDIQFDSDLIE
jgi:hypothetical protein